MPYDDVLDRESVWFGLNLTAQGVPSLTPTFAIVTPHLRRLSQRGHALYLAHGTPTGILNIGHGVGFRRSA